MRTLIIGGGAAGLYLSTLVPYSIIVEKEPRCGRKLYMTGGGRCNFTHKATVPELLPHYNGNLPFIRKVLYSHTPDDIIRHMESQGIKAMTEEDGRVFPETELSESVIMALMPETSRIIKGREAVSAVKNRGLFEVTLDDGQKLRTETLVIATGCSAACFPPYNGSGYKLLSSFGHTITDRHPALAPLRLERSISGAEGITTGIRIKAGRKEAEGDAVITHNGISGPVVLNMSRNVLDGDEITISFSDVDIKELRIREPKKLVRNAIDLPERLIRTLIGNLADKKIGNLSKDDERKIEENITAFRTRAWPVKQQAMTEAGGAILSEFNPVTMESKLVPGLYAAGDVLDVDADTGGYSLTWAFATAWCISRAVML